MKLAEIIRNAGLDTTNYPNSSNIRIRLYDGKDRISSEEMVHYVKPLFEQNPMSLERFEAFLEKLEEAPTFMNVKVDVDSVVLFYKDPRATTFLRKKSINPFDYMD